MFELKYKITDEDMKTVNKSIMWQYFIPYMIVAVLGLASGIAAVVLNIRTDIFVLGIVLIVLGAILLCCTVMLLIAPKNFVASALIPSDTVERTVKIGDIIDVETPDQENIEISYGEISKLKNKKTYLLAYVGKDIVLVIKDSSESKLGEVYDFISAKLQSATPVAPAALAAEKPQEEKAEEVKEEIKEEPAEEKAEETTEEKVDETDNSESVTPAEEQTEPVAEEKAEEVKEETVEEKAEEVEEKAAEEKQEEVKEKPAAKKAPQKKSTSKKKPAAK